MRVGAPLVLWPKAKLDLLSKHRPRLLRVHCCELWKAKEKTHSVP
jgi:hypothetical protein